MWRMRGGSDAKMSDSSTTGIAAGISGADYRTSREHGRVSLKHTAKGKSAEGDKMEKPWKQRRR